MRREQILLDDESVRILDAMAEAHAGDRSLAVREALKTQNAVEDILDQVESLQAKELQRQKRRSEDGFRKGKFTTWDEVKRKNNL